jgi:hypothetical protein
MDMMQPISLDTTLNLFWGAFALATIGVLGYLDQRRLASPLDRRRLFTLLLVCLCLFPVISFSDDLFRYSLMRVDFGGQGKLGSAPSGEENDPPSPDLIRLLQSLDHWQVESAAVPGVILRYAGTAESAPGEATRAALPCVCGRAPPLG